jgi:hypothetical protein
MLIYTSEGVLRVGVGAWIARRDDGGVEVQGPYPKLLGLADELDLGDQSDQDVASNLRRAIAGEDVEETTDE